MLLGGADADLAAPRWQTTETAVAQRRWTQTLYSRKDRYWLDRDSPAGHSGRPVSGGTPLAGQFGPGHLPRFSSLCRQAEPSERFAANGTLLGRISSPAGGTGYFCGCGTYCEAWHRIRSPAGAFTASPLADWRAGHWWASNLAGRPDSTFGSAGLSAALRRWRAACSKTARLSYPFSHFVGGAGQDGREIAQAA